MSLSPPPKHFFKTACYFEGMLLVLAIVLGWLTDINPFFDLHFSEITVFYSLIGTLPLLLFFLFSEQLPFEHFRQIKKLLLQTLGESLNTLHWSDLLILSALAGISEEVLFRGVLQPWLEQSLGLNSGLIVSCLIFGLVHAITPLYGLLATLISYYLGLSLDYGESRNLLTPILIHTFYDFFAFMLLKQSYLNHSSRRSNDKK